MSSSLGVLGPTPLAARGQAPKARAGGGRRRLRRCDRRQVPAHGRSEPRRSR
ncbi:MAG: hypothetical protein MZW92_50275 [Comamonadaceae bacterium]|nr:hypothetical protein [Comamonadaceae bacterium]